MNSATSASTGFAPFALNRATPRIVFQIGQSEVKPGVREFAKQVQSNLIMAHNTIIEARVNQTFYANQGRRGESDKGDNLFAVGKEVYLSTKNLKLPKKRAKKLPPKFMGPYKIVNANTVTSTYELELPEELQARGIFPKFYSSLLRPFVPNDEQLFPNRDPKKFYDFGMPDNTEWVVEEIIGHQWFGDSIVFHVKWNLGDTTWEPLDTCDPLAALDRYLELMGAEDWMDLPRLKSAEAVRNAERSEEAPNATTTVAADSSKERETGVPVGEGIKQFNSAEMTVGRRPVKPRLRFGLDCGV